MDIQVEGSTYKCSFTRKLVFDTWLSIKDVESDAERSRRVFQSLSQRLPHVENMNTDELQNKIVSICKKLVTYWKQAHRIHSRLITKHGDWLNATIVCVLTTTACHDSVQSTNHHLPSTSRQQHRKDSDYNTRSKHHRLAELAKVTRQRKRPLPKDVPDLDRLNRDLEKAGFRCNECLREISGFRYTCVQCENWQLCGACDSRGAHAQHFVLRVPPRTSYLIEKSIKESIMSTLSNLLQNQIEVEIHPMETSLKTEVTDEETDSNPDDDDSLYACFKDDTVSSLKKEMEFYKNMDSVETPIKTEVEIDPDIDIEENKIDPNIDIEENRIEPEYLVPDEIPTTEVEIAPNIDIEQNRIEPECLVPDAIPTIQIDPFSSTPSKLLKLQKVVPSKNLIQLYKKVMSPNQPGPSGKQGAHRLKEADCGIPDSIKVENIEPTSDLEIDIERETYL